MIERDGVVFADVECKAQGKFQPHQRERGVERGARPVLGHGEFSRAELLRERVGIQRDIACGQIGREKLRQSSEVCLPLDAVPVGEAHLAPFQPHENIAEVRAEDKVGDIAPRHERRRIHISEPL